MTAIDRSLAHELDFEQEFDTLVVVGVGAMRTIRPAKPVLVRSAGIWTGRLHAWERRLDGWYGHATWTADIIEHSGMLRAEDLRPFERRWVEVPDVFGRQLPGELVGWRRRPGGYPWEGCVRAWESSERLGPATWYRHDEIRLTDRPPNFIDREAF